MQFGEYGFIGAGFDELRPTSGALGPGYRYVTWQVGARLRKLTHQGRIGFLPLRFRDVPRTFGVEGRLACDVAILQCAPPQSGTVNLGISCSIFPSVIEAARMVIAEIHPEMPRTSGQTEISTAKIDFCVEATGALGTLARSAADVVDGAIVSRVLELVPENAWVQLGVGAIPDAVLSSLASCPGVRLHSGMLSDALVDFLDRAPADTEIVTGEVAGSADLYRRLSSEPRISFQPTTLIHDVPYLSRLPRFVSINSAIEVDLFGQVNGETVDGHLVSGVGGSLDFVEGARCSAGGISILALRSTARDRSRIVPWLAAGTPVTIPRHAVDCVVTEHGVARLCGLDMRERAAALIEIAAPEFRKDLRAALHDDGKGGGTRHVRN